MREGPPQDDQQAAEINGAQIDIGNGEATERLG
jgi:hypothetical protein